MDIKMAIEYAQVALKNVQKENETFNKQVTAKQLGEMMWHVYKCYDKNEIHYKAKQMVNNLELI